MKRNKLTIDLGNTQLSDTQMKKLLANIHSTVKGSLDQMNTPAKTKSKPPRRLLTSTPPPKSVTATISATFTTVNPGLSELNATLNGVTKKLTKTGSLVFSNVSSGDVIIMQGKSLGTSDISIDVKASPQQMKFVPGTFNFNFFII